MASYQICKGAALAAGNNGLPFVKIANGKGTAEICLMGAHVTSFVPAGQPDVLWMSSICKFEAGTAIRGGIPVCWPWFGKNTENPDAPMHGLARVMFWQLQNAKDIDEGTTQVVLSLADDAFSRKFWNYSFKLEMTVTVSDTMKIDLKTTNTGKEQFTIGQALHTYFNVGDISQVAIIGFDGLPLYNKVAGHEGPGRRQGTIVIDQEIDEVYQNASGDAVIADAALGRKIVISKENSNSGVVWNPWIAKSQRMADFPDDGYKTMVCVETTNAMEDVRTVAPGASFTLSTTYKIAD